MIENTYWSGVEPAPYVGLSLTGLEWVSCLLATQLATRLFDMRQALESLKPYRGTRYVGDVANHLGHKIDRGKGEQSALFQSTCCDRLRREK